MFATLIKKNTTSIYKCSSRAFSDSFKGSVFNAFRKFEDNAMRKHKESQRPAFVDQEELDWERIAGVKTARKGSESKQEHSKVDASHKITQASPDQEEREWERVSGVKDHTGKK